MREVIDDPIDRPVAFGQLKLDRAAQRQSSWPREHASIAGGRKASWHSAVGSPRRMTGKKPCLVDMTSYAVGSLQKI